MFLKCALCCHRHSAWQKIWEREVICRGPHLEASEYEGVFDLCSHLYVYSVDVCVCPCLGMRNCSGSDYSGFSRGVIILITQEDITQNRHTNPYKWPNETILNQTLIFNSIVLRWLFSTTDLRFCTFGKENWERPLRDICLTKSGLLQISHPPLLWPYWMSFGKCWWWKKVCCLLLLINSCSSTCLVLCKFMAKSWPLRVWLNGNNCLDALRVKILKTEGSYYPVKRRLV